MALGVTFYLPDGDKHSHTKEYYESRIASAFGGRLAEELIYGPDKITSGAASDIEHATRIARDMVTSSGSRMCSARSPIRKRRASPSSVAR